MTMKDFRKTVEEDSDGCDPLLIDCGIATSSACQEKFKSEQWSFPHGHHRSVAQVYLCSHSNSTVSSLLPEAYGNETFSEYLRRLDTDAGLIAQFIWASDDSLAAMSFYNDLALSRPCSLNMCWTE